MRIRSIALVIVIIITSFSRLEASALRIDLRGVVSDSSAADRPPVDVFRGQLLVPFGETREVFTGPYSVRLDAAEASADTYAIAASFFGLGPKFHTLDYRIKLAVGDNIFVPPLPVKNDATVKYFITLIDDTSSAASAEPPLSDTTAWGISETVHYRTHWLGGSLADFKWNLKMAYLERIYNGFRKTFSVSSFNKIDYVFHPEPFDGLFLEPGSAYAIQPRKMWIDVIYGHEADGVTPRAAAELLLYKQWGYAPRWLVTGFAGYYFDNLLRMRKLADKFDPAGLDSLLSNEAWVDSDTGRIASGALARWLVDSEPLGKFMEFYKNSGPLDFRLKFADIYKRDFRTALGEFLEAARDYKPNPGELEYFASTYMELGDYATAREYLEEIIKGGGEDVGRLRPTLVKCLFWQGDYEAASKALGPYPFGENCGNHILSATFTAAAGHIDPYPFFVFRSFDKPCPEGLISLASYLLDKRMISDTDSILSKFDDKDKGTPEYLIESARLRMAKGQRADSLLAMAAAIALNRAQGMPHDPANYLVAGQAFLLMGDYDRAKENLETSHFLETRPYFLGLALLELGRLYDLKGERDRAAEYYNEVITIKAGAYQKSLAKKYLDKKYELKRLATSD